MANYERISQKKKIIRRTPCTIAEVSYEKRRRRVKKKASVIRSKIKKTTLGTKDYITLKDKKIAIKAK